jgi:hypothetical protein
VGPGAVEAWDVRGGALALCLHAGHARIVVVDFAPRTVTEAGRPFDGSGHCDALAMSDERVCAGGYESGVGCLPREGGPVRRVELPAPPTGLAADGAVFFAATDGGGLWRWTADEPPSLVLALPDLMSGVAAGPWGVVWGTGTEYAWRTRMLSANATEPEWIRPRPPPQVFCRDTPEACEWVSTVVGQTRGWVYFSAVNAACPLYRFLVEGREWEEINVPGEVRIGPAGVWVLDDEGGVSYSDGRNRRFASTGVTLAPGEAAVPGPDGVYGVRDGVLRRIHAAEDRSPGRRSR